MTLYDDRLRLAQTIAAQLLVDYGEAIVAIGLHGSMAHGTIDERSDLDFAIVTRDGADLHGRDIFFGDVYLSLGVVGRDDYVAEAEIVDDAWAIESDQYVNKLVLHDPDGVFDTAREAQERAVDEAADGALGVRARENLLGAMEWLWKAERCLDAASFSAASVCVTGAVVSLAQAVGLLQRIRWRGTHTAVAEAGASGRGIQGFTDEYMVAIDGSLDVPARMAAARVACRSLEAHLAGLGVPTKVDSLEHLLDERGASR
jgi:predicted nucleotidyltransferase